MALIKCPECGREISDKAVSCPSCGCPVTPAPQSEQPVLNAVSRQAVSAAKTPRKKNVRIVIAVVASLAIVICCVVGFWRYQVAKARSEYIQNLNEISSLMLRGGADAESLCNLTKGVWYNTIHKERNIETNPYTLVDPPYGSKFHDDFNDSLAVLYADESTKETISKIKDNRSAVSDLMSQLSQPTSEFERCYDTLTDLYDTYDKFTSLAISPSGSLQTYSSNFSDYDSDFASNYHLLITLSPEE